MTKLNDKQIAAITYLSQPKRGGLTYEQVAEEVGVDVRTLHRWRRDDAFNNALKHNIMAKSIDRLPEILEAVPDMILRDGNAAMLRTLMQSHGLLAEKVEVDSKVSVGAIDIEAIRARLAKQSDIAE